MTTRQPRKQRNQQERALLHERHDQLNATLADELRDEYGHRSARVNTGDTVEVMRGDHAGHEDEVLEVDLKRAVVMIEGVTVEKADGEEVLRPVDASNIRISDLNLADDRRRERLEGDSE